MKTSMRPTMHRVCRLLAGFIALSFAGPLIGCSNPNNGVSAGSPAPYNTPAPAPPPSNNPLTNMSTGKKVALLVGAAALYYMYKKHVNAQNQPASVQYYRSKNGGVYYRDANHIAHWVTPPAQGIQVPADEATQYEQEARQQGFREAIPSGAPGY